MIHFVYTDTQHRMFFSSVFNPFTVTTCYPSQRVSKISFSWIIFSAAVVKNFDITVPWPTLLFSQLCAKLIIALGLDSRSVKLIRHLSIASKLRSSLQNVCTLMTWSVTTPFAQSHVYYELSVPTVPYDALVYSYSVDTVCHV